MANTYFQFKQFTVQQDACAMKVTTDSCLFGAWCAAEMVAIPGEKTVLDIGAGTGLLSLMIAQKNNIVIDAVEIDAAAAAQALQNCVASGWHKSINVINEDILRMDFLKSYDYIISNPPFYENDLQSADGSRNTAHHSQKLSLHSLISIVAKSLKNDGTFFLLLPFKRRIELIETLQSHQLYIYKEILVQQTPKHQPFRVMLKGGREQKESETTTLSIADETKQYTTEFTALLKEYYLHL